MAVAAAIVVGVALGLSYSRKGLFLGSLTLVTVFLSVAAALAFGAAAVRSIGVQSPYAYSIAMASIALFAFILIRGALVFINDDVDFHPILERVGGAVTGLASGLMVVGFVCVCLLSMPFPKPLKVAQENAQKATALALVPCRAAGRLLPGRELLKLENILSASGSEYSSYVPQKQDPQPARGSRQEDDQHVPEEQAPDDDAAADLGSDADETP